ncbi:ArsR family transcriptional regulator, partial [Campylobacter coli]|nr:ArsR family transcriptional regulator [Campylobacter coli]
NADKENCIFATSAEIAEALETTRPAVSKELKILQDCNFIKKVRNSVYQINVDCVFKGSHTQRMSAKEKFTKPLKKP